MGKQAILTSLQFNQFQCFNDIYLGYDIWCYGILAFFFQVSVRSHLLMKTFRFPF